MVRVLALASMFLLGPHAFATSPTELSQIGRSSIGDRGMNSALAIGDNCAFVGSRDDGPVAVLDIADPGHPAKVGEFGSHRGSTPRELRVVPGSHTLAVLYYSLGSGLNQIDFYRWDQDCARPALVGNHSFGGRLPHEFYLWADPLRPGRVLLFVAMFGSGGDLEVVDASDPVHPRSLGGWTADRNDLPQGQLHSITLSADGRLAYLSLWHGGLAIADSGDFASAADTPRLRVLGPAQRNLSPPPGNVHSAVPVPGRKLLVTTDEIYPATGCPYGRGRLVDVSDPGQIKEAAELQVPENDPQRCRSLPAATWTSHNPTLTPNLALISWYSAGFQIFDISDPTHPALVVGYRAVGSQPRQRDSSLRGEETMTWSYPIVRAGLIYLADINQGLIVLRYRGPHEDEIDGLEFAEGNSNLTTVRSVMATATATPATSPVPVRASPSRRLSNRPPGLLVLVAALVLIIAVVLATVGWRRWSQRQVAEGAPAPPREGRG